MVDSVSAAANVNKSSNVRQEATGVTNTVDNVMSQFGLEKYSRLIKAGGYQNFLLHELDARGFNDFFKPQTVSAKGRPKKRELKGFKALMDTLKEMEAARFAREFPNDTDRAEAAKKGFRKLSAMEVQANLQVTVGI
jgi:hypothetical protein